MPLGKSASSRGGGRGRGGGAERVEQSGAAPTMDGVVRLSTAATQTELSMDALAKLEENQAELKVENKRLKQNGYVRKCKRKAKQRKRQLRHQQLKLATPKFMTKEEIRQEAPPGEETAAEAPGEEAEVEVGRTQVARSR